MNLRSGKSECIPYSISRDTDIPAFHMDWLLEAMNRGFIMGVMPQDMEPSLWSLKPEDTYAFVWWSRNYAEWLKHAARFDGYNHVFNMTILGFDPYANQKRMPDVNTQLDQAEQLIKRYGAHNFNWRFSPIPPTKPSGDEYGVTDWFRLIARRLGALGVTECYAAFMHEVALVKDERTTEERSALLQELAEIGRQHGIGIQVCWDDKKFLGVKNVFEAKCVNGQRMADQFKLPAPKPEPSCGCALSINFGSALERRCGMGCLYCYATDHVKVKG